MCIHQDIPLDLFSPATSMMWRYTQKPKMADIFENTILCRKCGRKMEKSAIYKNGFELRAIVCPKESCGERIIHPSDKADYNRFINLRNKEFKVKMRMVGNSYTVSIPKEIVHFMNEQKKIMDEMVRLNFEEMGRLRLNFDASGLEDARNTRVIKAKEVKIIKNNKPILHASQFLDSAHPERNKTIIKKRSLGEHK